MFKMNLLVTLRNLRKDYAYVFINLSGLILGIACFLILAIFLRTQLSYDRHFKDHQYIYRVADRLHSEDGSIAYRSRTSRELAELLAKNYPDILETVRFTPIDNTNFSAQLLRYDETKLYWENIYYADANVFKLFSHDILYGDPESALLSPGSIAINETVARTYFGDLNPVGLDLESDFGNFKVALVFKDLPTNTHLKYSALVSYQDFISSQPTQNYNRELWFVNAITYLRMDVDLDPQRIESMTWDLYDRYMAEGGARIGKKRSFYLEPLADIHLNSIVGGDQPRGSKFALIACAIMGIFVLAIACINSMNLAIARSIKRSNEVGLRKILGADAPQLILYFLCESMLLSFTALFCALVLVGMLLEQGFMNQLISDKLSFSLIQEPWLIIPIIIFGFLLGLGMGLYPAFYLANISPETALSSSARTGSGGKRGTVQQVLVVLQFTFSIAIISVAFLMASQINFLKNQAVGFNTDNLLLVKLRGSEVLKKIPTIKTALMRDNRVLGVASSLKVPGIDTAPYFAVQVDDGVGTLTSQATSGAWVDDDYLDLMGIKISEGRQFDENEVEHERILINETMSKRLNWRDQAVNKRIVIGGNLDARVMGVVKDFHFESLRQPVESLILRRFDPASLTTQNANLTGTLLVRLSASNIPSVLNHVRNTLSEQDPSHPPELIFYDQALGQVYTNERRLLNLVVLFAVLSVFISCMGLFGLSSFTTAQRTKEIGIRKILGASRQEILMMLFKDVAGLVAIASVISFALSYYAINQWLDNFSYRIDINLLVFLAISCVAIALAFITIALQGNKTINQNPAQSLRPN
ncbi:ABC transporter permease [Aurantivibrio infirmus]